MKRQSIITGYLRPNQLAEAIGSMMDTWHDDLDIYVKSLLFIEITDSVEALMNNVGHSEAEDLIEDSIMFPINNREFWRKEMAKIDKRRA